MLDHHDDLVPQFRQLAAGLAATHRLDDEQGEWLTLVHLAIDLVHGGAAPGELGILEQLAAALDDPEVVEAATSVLGVAGPGGGEGRERSAHALFTAVADRAPGIAGVHVALARSWEAMGDLRAMERSLREALRLDPDHVGAHDDLGELAALQGRFQAASRHFDRVGRPPIGLAAVAANLGSGPVRAGRNEACPCGSGARFKACCLATDGWPLDTRVELLPHRLADWVGRPMWLRRRLSFAAAVAGVEDVADAPDRVLEAALIPAMVDLYLFDGGGIGQLVEEIGPVLHADERDVLARWTGCRHALYEVFDAAPGRSRLVHVRTGEARDVGGIDVDRLGGSGGVVLAVLVPAAPAAHRPWMLAGEAIPLDDGRVDELRAIAGTGGEPVAVARAAIAPALAFEQAVRAVTSEPDPRRDERLRWLLGDRVDVECVRDLDELDDLVTTTHMRGGGLSPAADHLRWAARQIVEGEPPEVWETAEQLTAAGHDRGTVLVHLAAAWAVAAQHGPDPDAVRAAHLANLRSTPARADDERRRRS